jgi:predicted phage baseplate assembly protein
MALPVPDLDDRHFQDLVDDAKRMVQKQCPEWTDHNVSDPGVTLIETFAFMVDQLLWRLNRVPDRIYVKFLELLGMRLQPPSAARAEVTFWLSGVRPELFTVPAGTVVTTTRTEHDEAIEFTTVADLEIVPCALSRFAVEAGGNLTDETMALGGRDGVQCFGLVPRPGHAFYVALPDAVPSCIVVLRLQCDIEGVGVDPEHPPIVWEAWNGSGWSECDLEQDGTGGLNQAGDIVLHVPPTHVPHSVQRSLGGWLRCRTTTPETWQPFYRASPRITRLDAFTMGGTAPAINARIVVDEVIGSSEGVAGEVFPLQHRPVVEASEIPSRLVVSQGTGWQEWNPVENFATSGPEDLHYVLDGAAGEVRFGPAVQLPDGTLQHFGRVPAAGSSVKIRRYCSGGGRGGNVAAGALSVLRTSLPYIGKVENRRAASGGVDGETMDNAKLRGALQFRSRDRAVTTFDYEHLTREAAVEVARVRCLANGDADRRHAVNVLVVPHVGEGPHGAVDLAALAPSEELLGRVAAYLDERRTVGSRVVVEPPRYMAITVVASLRCRQRHDPGALEGAALDAIYGYFHPLRGGPEGDGWPFGRPVNRGEVFAVLQALPGLDYVDDVRLYPANPLDGSRGDAAERIDLGPEELIFSFGHQVRVRS